MKKQLQRELNNETYTVAYECKGCGHETTKTAVLAVTLPAFYSEQCPKCGKEQVFLRKGK